MSRQLCSHISKYFPCIFIENHQTLYFHFIIEVTDEKIFRRIHWAFYWFMFEFNFIFMHSKCIFNFFTACTCKICNWKLIFTHTHFALSIIGKYFYLNAWCFYQINTHTRWFVVIAIGALVQMSSLLFILCFFLKSYTNSLKWNLLPGYQ
jgi:hypothetical protein